MTTQAEKDSAVGLAKAKTAAAIDELALLIVVEAPIPPAVVSNVALASAGALSLASSTLAGYPLAAINDGDRTGAGWSKGSGGWANGTLPLPAWVQINFTGAKALSSVNVFTLQDDFLHPVEPTDALTFTKYGIKSFVVDAWNGTAWVPLGSVANNSKVKNALTFAAPVVCNAIRVTVTQALVDYARIVEVEAFGVPSSAVLAPPPGAVVVPPAQTLTELAASMPPDSWAELATGNIDAVLLTTGGTGGGNAIPYCGAMPWDPIGRRAVVIGMDHGDVNGPRVMEFRDATTDWAFTGPGKGTHGYQHTTVNPATGEVYQLQLAANAVDRGIFKRTGTTWAKVAPEPENLGSLIAMAVAWWSGTVVGGGAQGALVLYVGNSGNIHLWDPLASAWRTFAAMLPGQSGQYQNVCVYSKLKNCLIYGGGNLSQGVNPVDKQLWRMNADGTKTRMPDAPFSVGVDHGMCLTGSANGNILLCGFGQLWELDPTGNGTLTRRADPPADLRVPQSGTGYAGNSSTSVDCAPHGVTLYVDVNNARTPKCKVRAYKPFESAPVGGTGLAVTLDFGGGKVAQFSGGADLGTYDDPDTGIHQRSFMATDAAFPAWRVFFCPDVDGQRNEVMVLYGAATGGAPINWTTPYTATVKSGATTLYTTVVPKHFWYACWRWQSAPRPVVRTPATLRQRNWIPNFGASANPPVSGPAVKWGGPMTLPPNMNPVMGTAGDSVQLGLLTEAGADYMLTGSAAALESLRTEAEAVGSWPIHMVNPDGSLLNARGARYPEFGGNVNQAPASADPAYMQMDYPHQYASANAAWLLTGDPFFLRGMQALTTAHQMYASYHRLNQHLEGLLYPGQTRSMAWGLRDLSLVTCTTPTTTPKWLHPRAKWKADLDDNLTYALRFVAAPARLHSVFRAWTRGDIVNHWMSAWLTTEVGMVVLQGFTEWRPVFDWSVGMQLATTNGTSGWNKQLAAEYDTYPSRDLALPGSPDPYPVATDANACADWAAFFAYHVSGSGGRTPVKYTTGWDGHTLMSTNGSYAGHVRASLAVAAKVGTVGALTCYDWLHAEIMRKFGSVQSRFAVDA